MQAFVLALVASLALAGVAAGSASALSYVSKSGLKSTFNVEAPFIAFQPQNGEQFNCQSGQGTATMPNGGTSGSISMQLHNCSQLGGLFGCTSPGAPGGTILTNSLEMKPVYLNEAKTKYGLALTSSTGIVAEFTCGGSAQTMTGSVLGEITSPPLETWSSNFSELFESGSSPWLQHWTSAEGKTYGLERTKAGSTEKLAMVTTFSLHVTGGDQGKFKA